MDIPLSFNKFLNFVLGNNNWIAYCIYSNKKNHDNFSKEIGKTYDLPFTTWKPEEPLNFEEFDIVNYHKTIYTDLFRYIIKLHPNTKYFFILKDNCHLENKIEFVFDFLYRLKKLYSNLKWDILWFGLKPGDLYGKFQDNVHFITKSNNIHTLLYKRETITTILDNINNYSSMEEVINSKDINFIRLAPFTNILDNYDKNKNIFCHYGSFYDYTNIYKSFIHLTKNINYKFNLNSKGIQKFFMPYDILNNFLKNKLCEKFKNPIIIITENDDITDIKNMNIEEEDKILKIGIISNTFFEDTNKLVYLPKAICIKPEYRDYITLMNNLEHCNYEDKTLVEFTDENFSQKIRNNCYIRCNNEKEVWLTLLLNRIPIINYENPNDYIKQLPIINSKEEIDYTNFFINFNKGKFNTDILNFNYWRRKIYTHNNKKLNYKLLVAVMTKNVVNNISNVLYNVETYISLFNDHEVCIVDGYSDDGTLEYCKKWCNKDKDKRVILSQIKKGLSRPKGLEEARNMYIEHFESYFNKDTYMLCLDGDEVNADDFDIEGFLSNFQYSDWDGMFCNNTNGYYDIWALRKEDCNYDCWEMYRKTNDMSYVDRHVKKIDRTHPIISVTSAFGGAGLYYTDKLKGIRYKSYIGDKEICEHVPYNEELVKRGGKLYINPDFINM